MIGLFALALAAPDRATPPPVVDPVPMDWPAPERVPLQPGVEVVGWQLPGARRVEIQVLIHAGAWALDGPDAAASLALHDQWGIATTSWEPAELSALLDSRDIGMYTSVQHDHASAGVECHPDDLTLALEVLRQLLQAPAFPASELSRYKRDTDAWITRDGPNDLRTVLSWTLDHAWYPLGGPYAQRPDLRALQRLKPSDLASRHHRLLHEWPITVLVSGDAPVATLADLVRPALAGLGADVPRAPHPGSAAPSGPHALLIEAPGATQAAIGVAMAAPTRTHADATAFRQADFALGGHFLARLNRNLREEHGWTYGIYSDWVRDDAHALWSADAIVSAENVAEALAEIAAEIERVRADGVTPEEIDAAWRDAVSGWNTARRTAGDAVGLLRSLELSGHTTRDRLTDLASLRAVQPAMARAAARAWLGADHALWIIVGDPAALEPELSALPWPVRRVSAADAMLGAFEPPGHPR